MTQNAPSTAQCRIEIYVMAFDKCKVPSDYVTRVAAREIMGNARIKI